MHLCGVAASSWREAAEPHLGGLRNIGPQVLLLNALDHRPNRAATDGEGTGITIVGPRGIMRTRHCLHDP